jgi:predicted nuclease of predicted toxin-antitoxin system
LKLLLDEMFSAAIAETLRARGRDVIAAQESAELRHRSDEELLEIATRQDRILATENVADVLTIDAAWRAVERAHAGIVLTSNRRFSRHDRRYVGRLVAALDGFMAGTPHEAGFVRWL